MEQNVVVLTIEEWEKVKMWLREKQSYHHSMADKLSCLDLNDQDIVKHRNTANQIQEFLILRR